MTFETSAAPSIPNMSPTEWQSRVDLAAAHRIAHASGWSQLIYNHFTLRVANDSEHFLIKPNDLLFEEVTASSLLKLNMEVDKQVRKRQRKPKCT